MRHSDQILLSYFGDGASNEGEFHESLNMASVWKLPVVFICDNNQYGMSMHVSELRMSSISPDRAVAYGIPGVTVDGNDVLAVYEAVRRRASTPAPGGSLAHRLSRVTAGGAIPRATATCTALPRKSMNGNINAPSGVSKQVLVDAAS
jgi:hypothetical protein